MNENTCLTQTISLELHSTYFEVNSQRSDQPCQDDKQIA